MRRSSIVLFTPSHSFLVEGSPIILRENEKSGARALKVLTRVGCSGLRLTEDLSSLPVCIVHDARSGGVSLVEDLIVNRTHIVNTLSRDELGQVIALAESQGVQTTFPGAVPTAWVQGMSERTDRVFAIVQGPGNRLLAFAELALIPNGNHSGCPAGVRDASSRVNADSTLWIARTAIGAGATAIEFLGGIVDAAKRMTCDLVLATVVNQPITAFRKANEGAARVLGELGFVPTRWAEDGKNAQLIVHSLDPTAKRK